MCNIVVILYRGWDRHAITLKMTIYHKVRERVERIYFQTNCIIDKLATTILLLIIMPSTFKGTSLSLIIYKSIFACLTVMVFCNMSKTINWMSDNTHYIILICYK